MLATLRRRNFALLWIGALISLIGDRALLIALPFFVYQQTGSTLAMAGIFGVYYLPTFLFASVAGVFADRWDRKRILVVTNLIQSAVMLLLLLVHSSSMLWIVYAVTFVQMTLAMFTTPAEGALLPNLVEESQLVTANSLVGLGTTIARLVGPLAGGLLIGLFGISSVVIVDSVSFLLAALLIVGIVQPPPAAAPAPDVAQMVVSAWRQVAEEWRAGLRLVRHSRLLVGMFVVMNVTSLGGTLIDPLYVPFVTDRLHAGSEGLGLLSTVGGLGGLVGGVLMGWIGNRIRPRDLTCYGTILVGLLMLLLYNQTSFAFAVVAEFMLMAPVIGSNVGATTMLQTGTPDRYRGRVYGALGTTNALVGLVAVGLSGSLGQVVGVVPMLWVAGSITILAGLLGLVLLPRQTSQPAESTELQETVPVQ